MPEWIGVECPECGAGPDERCRAGCICEHPAWADERDRQGVHADQRDDGHSGGPTVEGTGTFGPE